MNPVTVTFVYDEKTRKWDPIILNAENEKEARQAFNAVVLTCQALPTQLLSLGKVQIIEQGYRIIPAV